MAGLTKRALVLAKIEATEGTPEAPTAATDSLLVSNISVQNTGDELERDIMVDNFSSLGFVVARAWGEVSFQTELRNPNTALAATAPLRENPLYCAAGMSPSYNAASVVYRPLTSWIDKNSITLFFYMDGLLHVFAGCRGNLALEATVGQYGKLTWTFQGMFATISSPAQAGDGVRDATIASAGAPTYQGFTVKPPAVVGASLSLPGPFTTAKVNSVSFDLGNQLVRRDDMSAAGGIASVFIGDRKVTGKMNPEQELRATHDFWGKWFTGAQGAMSFTLGTVSPAWNRIKVDAGGVQYKKPTLGDRGGLRIYDMEFSCNRVSAGDDEISISYLAA